LEAEGVDARHMTRHELGEAIFDRLKAKYGAKEQLIGDVQMRFHERMIMLSVIDGLWKDPLLNMDHRKEGIGLRGYAQQDPLVAYKKESFEMFEAMMLRFQEDTARHLFRMQIIGPDGTPIESPDQLPRQNAAPTLDGSQLAGNAPSRLSSGAPAQQPPAEQTATPSQHPPI